MNIEQGKKLIGLAKKTIRSELSKEDLDIEKNIKKDFDKKQGVFVTITIDKQLRGCIGIPYPTEKLWKNLISSAKSAAFKDPRFRPLTKEEFENIEIEVSVLTEPKRISPINNKNLKEKIKIGKDGLIIKKGLNSGLLLPQVATEQRWDAKTFIEQTCTKAGLDIDEWKDSEIYTFQADIFSEKKGNIIKKG